MGSVDNILEFRHISKHYPGVMALNDVSISIRRGEIHALVGENGAGKSTLIKTCSGAIEPSEGEIIVNGKTFKRLTPKLSEENGIGVIYQEFNLVGDLSVAENIFLGRAIRKGIVVDQKAMQRESKKILDSLHIDINPKALVKNLSVGYQQMVEIAKAMSQNAQLLVQSAVHIGNGGHMEPLFQAVFLDQLLHTLAHIVDDSGILGLIAGKVPLMGQRAPQPGQHNLYREHPQHGQHRRKILSEQPGDQEHDAVRDQRRQRLGHEHLGNAAQGDAEALVDAAICNIKHEEQGDHQPVALPEIRLGQIVRVLQVPAQPERNGNQCCIQQLYHPHHSIVFQCFHSLSFSPLHFSIAIRRFGVSNPQSP